MRKSVIFGWFGICPVLDVDLNSDEWYDRIIDDNYFETIVQLLCVNAVFLFRCHGTK